MSDIERWPASAPGRSRAVAFGDTVWLVANARNLGGDFPSQVKESLALLDHSLNETGSDRSRILSMQVLLADLDRRSEFDEIWREWIDSDPAAWPQRAVFQVGLAAGLLVELIVVAARNGGHPAV